MTCNTPTSAIFYKVEKWSRDGMRMEQMLYAHNSLGKVQAIFSAKAKHRSRIQLTIEQRMRVLEQWPPHRV
jgi:hypothetical protein